MLIDFSFVNKWVDNIFKAVVERMWVWATCCVVKCSCGHFCFADQIRICYKGNAWPKLSPLFQPKGKKAKGKKVAPAPSVAKKHEAKKVVNPLFEKRPKNFGIGKFPNFNFAENISLWCAWCKRIFAILTTMMTIFPPRSLMHFSLKSRKLEFEVPVWKPVFVFDLPQARTFSPSVIWRALWNGLATSACRGSAPSFTNVWRFPLQSTSSPRLWIARQVCLVTHGPQNLSLD